MLVNAVLPNAQPFSSSSFSGSVTLLRLLQFQNA